MKPTRIGMPLHVHCDTAVLDVLELLASPGAMLGAFPCCIHLALLGLRLCCSAVGRGAGETTPDLAWKRQWQWQ